MPSPDPHRPVADRPSTLRTSILLGSLCAALVGAGLWLYTRHNGFPRHYHPDEWTKVAQVLRDFRNYRHPQLLLESTRLAAVLTGALDDRDAITLLGRWVSALFGAVAAAALALIGWRAGRWGGFAAVGCAVLLCPALLVHAHYIKEDTALMLGLSVTLLAASALLTPGSERGRPWAAALLGVGIGLSVSGKYSGLYAAVALGVLPWAPPGRRWRTLLVAALTAPAVWLAVNRRAFLGAEQRRAFVDALRFETEHSVTNHGAVTLPFPNGYFAETVLAQTGPHVLLPALALAALPLVPALRRHASRADVFLVLFTLGYLALLCCCRIPVPRYALPVVVLVHALGALGAIRLAQAASPRPRVRSLAAAGFVLMALLVQGPVCADFTRQFRDDSRFALAAWMRANVSPSEPIAQDARAGLQTLARGPEADPPYQIRGDLILPMLGSLDSLRRAGVRYVVIADASYGRYFDPRIKPYNDPQRGTREYDSHRAFYEELMGGGHELLWSSPPARPMHAFTNPHIRVYRLRPLDDTKREERRRRRPKGSSAASLR